MFVLVGCTTAPTKSARNADEASSLSPASDQVYKCLTQRGWNVTLTWDGGIEVSSDTVPTEQREAFDADANDCWAPINERVAMMSPDEIAKVYDSEVRTRTCLIALGYEVGQPPSKQSFVDSFHGLRWSAYADSNVNAADDELWHKANVQCPQPAWSLGV